VLSERQGNFIPKALLEMDEAPTAQMPPAFHIMLKPRGPICNLDCTYCFYLRKEQLYGKRHEFLHARRCS
jgi:Arylsulfatase regulator (Fe-S oxidoreductase)